MSWSAAFLAALSGRHYRPTWLLEVVRTPVAGQADVWASHATLGPDALAGLPRVGGSSVVPISWRPSYGTWSVTGQGDGARAIATLPRGAVVRLLAGFAGIERADMEPIALGVVHRLTGGPSSCTVECWDLLSVLRCRWTQTLGQGDLFFGLAGGKTTTASSYTAGAATLVLTAASGMLRMSGGTGAVLVEPTVGDPFYLTFTGITSNTLTGCSSTGQFDTTAVDAASGSTAKPVAYLYDHPLDIVRRVLLSGSGTTDYDVLPSSWGFALPEDLVDIEDCEDWKSRLAVSSGSYSWGLLATERQPTGLNWLQTYLSTAGIWICTRQGRITVRSALDVSSTRDMEEIIGEDDAAGAWSWEYPDPQIPTEYRKVRVVAGSDYYEIGSTLESMPAEDSITYDLSEQVWDNGTAICTETCRRLAPWANKIPEVLTLPCRGWRLAGLCPGDPVRLDLPRITGQLTGRSASYDAWPATVISVSPDYTRHQTTVRVWPDRESI